MIQQEILSGQHFGSDCGLKFFIHSNIEGIANAKISQTMALTWKRVKSSIRKWIKDF